LKRTRHSTLDPGGDAQGVRALRSRRGVRMSRAAVTGPSVTFLTESDRTVTPLAVRSREVETELSRGDRAVEAIHASTPRLGVLAIDAIIVVAASIAAGATAAVA